MTRKWLVGAVFASKPSLSHWCHFPWEKVKQSMEVDIGRCWHIMSAHKCVKKVWTVTGFTKTLRHATLLTKEYSFCNKNSTDVWCQKMATLIGHQELQTWPLQTSFCGVIWKAKFTRTTYWPAQGKHSWRNQRYTARNARKSDGKRSKKGTFYFGQ